MTEADLEYLRQPSARNVVQKLNDAHLRMARLFAQGLSNPQVAAITGYNPARVSLLRNDPAMRERVARIQDRLEEEAVEDITDLDSAAIHAMTAAQFMLVDKIEAARDAGEFLPTRELLAIISDGQDRYGQSRKSTSTSINLNLAANMEAIHVARTRKVTPQ